VGQHRTYLLGPNETLIELARRSGTGYMALIQANPGIDPWLPPAGEKILLPYAFLLPQAAQEGITINLAELRLYYLWTEQGQQRVRAYPVGIGSEGWNTPEGYFTVAQHIEHPSWTAPATIRAAEPGTATSIPPGPNNPLGDYWLGLSAAGYGIHGTNKPFGVGRRVSHGCLRLYPEDIRDLFRRAGKGTPVRIIYQPIKVGLHNGQIFAEIHQDLDRRISDPVAEVLRQIATLPWRGKLDRQALSQAIADHRGVPVVISKQ
jgi:L,D-transpeptidase ErfK/SrfK